LLEHLRGDVHPYRASADSGVSRLACGLTRTAADVKHAVAGADAGSDAEKFVVQKQLRVIVEQLGHHCHQILSIYRFRHAIWFFEMAMSLKLYRAAVA
jgi:hypothetical protein